MKQKTPWLYTVFGLQLGAKQVQVECRSWLFHSPSTVHMFLAVS
jgi:hypothetical protein